MVKHNLKPRKNKIQCNECIHFQTFKVFWCISRRNPNRYYIRKSWSSPSISWRSWNTCWTKGETNPRIWSWKSIHYMTTRNHLNCKIMITEVPWIHHYWLMIQKPNRRWSLSIPGRFTYRRSVRDRPGGPPTSADGGWIGLPYQWTDPGWMSQTRSTSTRSGSFYQSRNDQSRLKRYRLT